MDYISCVTGKSPSTTGAGSEGALSKGPFSAIGATADLNNMLVSTIITQYGGFSIAAGYIGPKYRADRDISLLVPELWCRMTPKERDPKYMINAYVESLVVTTCIGADPAIHDGYNLVERDGQILTDMVAFIWQPLVYPHAEITKLEASNKIIFLLL
jgi:hypothetical protein